MPTTNTHKQDAIADAVISLAAEQGISCISLRNVAREAGISMGQVQYYFSTASDMIAAAVQRALEQLNAFAANYVMSNMGDGSPVEMLKVHAFTMINTDPLVRTMMRVLGQFESQYERDSRVGALLARNDPALQQMTRDLVKAGIEAGTIQSDVDPVEEARLYWVLVGTLSVELAMDSIDLDRAREVFCYYLNRMVVKDSTAKPEHVAQPA